MPVAKAKSPLRRTAVYFLALVSLSLAASWSAKVVGVSDGDTISVMHEGKAVKIRLHGIDCPETGQPFGTKAKQFASSHVFGKEVRIDPVEHDKYGRLVATVYIQDGRILNHELVRNGFAWWYKQYAPGDTVLAGLEKEAREGWRGLWSEENPIPPWDWRNGERERRTGVPGAPRGPPDADPPPQKSLAQDPSDDPPAPSQEIVYRTRTGAKYHRDGCRYLKSRIPTTVAEASSMGLAPCSSCGPPSASSTVNSAQVPTEYFAPRAPPPSYSGRCQATTKKGTQCKRSASPGGMYCWQHES